MDGEKDKQRRFSARDKAAAGLQSSRKNSYIICSVQPDSYPLQVDSATGWIHESERITLSNAPICWEPRSYWWSRPESPGCSQGLPEDWHPWCCRTAAAAGSTDDKKKKRVTSELHPDSVLSSPTHTPVSFILHRTEAVSVCGRQPNIAWMMVQGLSEQTVESGSVRCVNSCQWLCSAAAALRDKFMCCKRCDVMIWLSTILFLPFV